MSDTKLPQTIELPAEPTSDIGEADMKRLVTYIEEGLPGIIALTPEKINDMLILYLDGASYSSIAMDMCLKKELVLYAAHKGNWFEAKKAHLAELATQLAQTASETKIKIRVTMKRTIDHHSRIMNDRIGYFNKTRDTKTKEEIDRETLRYAKLVEQYVKLEDSDTPPPAKAPLVNVNMGEGANIRKNKDNSIDITPARESKGSMLERLAEEEREEERRKKTGKSGDTSDIKEE